MKSFIIQSLRMKYLRFEYNLGPTVCDGRGRVILAAEKFEEYAQGNNTLLNGLSMWRALSMA